MSRTFPPQIRFPRNQPSQAKRLAEEAVSAPTGKRAMGNKLAVKVDQLSAEMSQMRELLLALQPKAGTLGPPVHDALAEDDALSIAASATQFGDFMGDTPSYASESLSHCLTQGSSHESEDASMGAIMCGALAHLQLDALQEGPAPVSAFFRRQHALAFGGLYQRVACLLK